MPVLIFGATSYEINQKRFLEWIAKVLEGYYSTIDLYQAAHISGFADLFQKFMPGRKGYPDNFDEIEAQISDQYLAHRYINAKKQLELMISLDTEIIKWLAGYVKITSLVSKKDWQRFRHRINRIIVGGPNGTVQGSVWILTKDYQALLSRSQIIYVSFMDTYMEAQARITELDKATQE